MSKELKMTPDYRFPEFKNNGDWNKDSLINIAKFRRGSFPQPYGLPEWYDDENGMPFIQVYDVDDNFRLKKTTKRKISELAAEQSVFIEKGTVIITIQGSIGRVAITQYDAYIDRTLLIFQEFYNDIDKTFFAHILFLLFEIEKLKAPGGIIKTITKEVLSDFVVSFPEIPEQQKIASCLSSLDELIAAHNDKLDALKDHKKGLLQNLFPQEGETVPKVRFPEFEDDGEWELKNVEEFFNVGSSKRVLQKDWTNEGVPFYRTRELVSLSKNEPFGSEIYISEELYEELKTQYGVPTEGDFLVSGVGTLGISYQVKTDDKFYFKDGNVLWFKLEGDLVSSYFKYCFESEHIQKQIVGQTSKSTVGTYTITNAKKTEFWYTDNPQEQQKIASCLSAVDELITAQQEKIEQLQQHKKGLMQGLFPKIER